MPAKISQNTILDARKEVLNVRMAPALEEYLLQFIMATRKPEKYKPELENFVEYGASPRGTLALDICAKAHAWLDGRDFVKPEDIRDVLHDVLRHRILLTYEAEARGITPDSFIDLLVQEVPMP